MIEAIDYLVRVGREDQALPLAQKLVDSNPGTEELLEVKNRFGSGKLLGLFNTRDARLKQLLVQFASQVSTAAKSEATDEERITALIGLLSASKEEAELARERLARVGNHAVGPLIEAYASADATSKPLYELALSELEVSALPALIGAVRHPDPAISALVARALGSIGDASALPSLAYLSTKQGDVGKSAQEAWKKVSGGLALTRPVQVLTDASARYLDRDVYFPSDKVEIWYWDEADSKLNPILLERSVAEGAIGYRLCRLALEIDPSDITAQTLAVSTLLQEESDRLGTKFPAEDPSGVWAIAKATGPDLLTQVLNRALKTGKHEKVAVLAVQALSEVTAAPDLNGYGIHPHVLVEALASPSRRVQFEAARTVVKLKPTGGFSGASRVIPILARFVQASPQYPRAVVIHNNLVEGGEWIAYLRNAGYDPVLEVSGRDGFAEAARRGDAELILISTTLDPYGWALPETISNFKADARTAGIPLMVVGPLSAKMNLRTLLHSHPGVGFMVSPANQQLANRQIQFQLSELGIEPLSPDERVGYSQESLKLLSKLYSQAGRTGVSSMISSLEPSLMQTLIALSDPSQTAAEVAKINREALANQVLQETLSPEDRARAALELASDIQKDGQHLSPPILKKCETLFLSLETDGNPALRNAVAVLVGVNHPGRDFSTQVLTKFAPHPEVYEVKP
jgi:hypothetical protein